MLAELQESLNKLCIEKVLYVNEQEKKLQVNVATTNVKKNIEDTFKEILIRYRSENFLQGTFLINFQIFINKSIFEMTMALINNECVIPEIVDLILHAYFERKLEKNSVDKNLHIKKASLISKTNKEENMVEAINDAKVIHYSAQDAQHALQLEKLTITDNTKLHRKVLPTILAQYAMYLLKFPSPSMVIDFF